MSQFLRKFIKQILIFSNILTVILFLLACLAAYCNPVTYWLIAILGVGFIFITFAVALFLIVWLLARSKWAILSFLALLIGWFQIKALFAFNLFFSFNETKKADCLRVLTWNVSRFDQMNKHPGKANSNRHHILEFIKAQNADVLCIQEFFESHRPSLYAVNIPVFIQQLNYPYYYFAGDHIISSGAYAHGVAIFSRYPIIDTLRIRYQGADSLKGTESLIRATIDIQGKKINIFTTHLQSFLFSGNDYRGISNIRKGSAADSMVAASKGIVFKFRKSYGLRSLQADLVRRQLDSSSYPEIICGDFNDVPNSYTYFTIKGERQDAFFNKSFGLGRTFVFISPTLRIDYIMANKKFDILQYKKTKLPYSDHFPLVADFKLSQFN